MGRLNDISLVTRVAVLHDRRAFDRLVRETQSPLRRFFLSQTMGNEALSDDLSQDTYLRAYTHIGQFRGTSSFMTWLMRIAYNVWYDHTRKSRLQPIAVDSAELRESLHPAQGREVAGMEADLYTALAQLRDEERTCIVLQLIDGYAIDEIGSITGMPTGTVKSHLKRGKDKLANYLRQNGYDR